MSPHSFRLERVPLSSIQIDPAYVPRALGSKDCKPDESLRERYFLLMLESSFPQPLTIAKQASRYSLIFHLEAYLAYQDYYSKSPHSDIQCLVIENADEVRLQQIAKTLDSFSTAKNSHLSRLLQKYSMWAAGVPDDQIRRAQNLRTASDARMHRRDMSIIRNEALIERIPGIPGAKEGKPSMKYGFILKVLHILRDDPQCIAKFLTSYDDEIEKLRQTGMSPEEETKPPYTWRNFNEKKLLDIARSIALGNHHSNLAASSLHDQRWSVGFNEETGEYHLPAISINVWRREPENIKKFIAISYMTAEVAKTFQAHLWRIRPINHGGNVKGELKANAIKIPVPSNLPELEDLKYVEFIRRNKLIAYADREFFLRCLRIRPGHFGFDTSEPDAQSTYALASSRFQNWFTDIFTAEVTNYFSGNPKKHPAFQYVTRIQEFILKRAHFNGNIYFSDFFPALFSRVFKQIDDLEDENRRVHSDFMTIEKQLQDSLSYLFERQFSRSKTARITREQLERLIQERIVKRESELSEALSMQNHLLEKITEDPISFQAAKQSRSPITLRDVRDSHIRDTKCPPP